MNKKNTQKLTEITDISIKSYEENGKKFISILKRKNERPVSLGRFEVSNSNLNDVSATLKEISRLGVTL
jgi:hypothetical protein